MERSVRSTKLLGGDVRECEDETVGDSKKDIERGPGNGNAEASGEGVAMWVVKSCRGICGVPRFRWQDGGL